MPAKIWREPNPETLKIIQRIDAELERVRPLLRENDRIILKIKHQTAYDIVNGLSRIKDGKVIAVEVGEVKEELKIRFNCEVVIDIDNTLQGEEFKVTVTRGTSS